MKRIYHSLRKIINANIFIFPLQHDRKHNVNYKKNAQHSIVPLTVQLVVQQSLDKNV